MRTRIYSCLFLMAVPLAGCFGLAKTEPAASQEMDLLTASKLTANAFAADLFEFERDRAGPNVAVCPPAARKCLSVAAFLARGETRTGLARAAHLPADDRALEAEGLAQSANMLSQYDPFEKTELFLDSDHLKLNPGYAALLSRYWGAQVTEISFADPAKALRHMNGKVEHADGEYTTRGSSSVGTPIPLPFSAADIAATRDSATGLMLVSRTHFHRYWKTSFPSRATRENSFRMTDGTTLPVPMMHLVEDLPCAKLPGATLLRLPYGIGDATLLLLLPDEGVSGPKALTTLMRVSPSSWQTKLSLHHATVYLPRFDIVHRAAVREFAATRGATAAFDRAACDFSAGLAVVSPAAIKPAAGEIRQETYFKINEHQTDAGSITAMNFATLFGAEPEKPKYPEIALRFDRPFGFILELDGLIHFAGWCGKPTLLNAEDRAQFALNAVPAALDAAIRKHRAEHGDTPIKVAAIAHALKTADGKAVALSWKEGDDTYRTDATFPDAVLDPARRYDLVYAQPSVGTLSCSYDLPKPPDSPRAKSADSFGGSE